GVPDPHHPLTHHRGNPEWIEKVTKVNSMHMELFAAFVKKLKDTPDGDGTLLDHSVLVYGSGLSDGNRHTHDDLPDLIVGGCSNFFWFSATVFAGPMNLTKMVPRGPSTIAPSSR